MPKAALRAFAAVMRHVCLGGNKTRAEKKKTRRKID
jgi:hypothetical protein